MFHFSDSFKTMQWCIKRPTLFFFSREATLELVLSSQGVVMLNLGCGYVQKGVVMLSVVWLC